jgi:uncharacterized cupin superfamily protein
VLRAGDCAAFLKGDGNGHHLVNRASSDATCLEIGTRSAGEDVVLYSDIDLKIDQKDDVYTHRDGTPYRR